MHTIATLISLQTADKIVICIGVNDKEIPFSIISPLKMLTSFKGTLYGPVDVGHLFVISGKSVDGANIFFVNFASGRGDGADIPFHLSVHFHSETILRNSLIDQVWGDEEVDEGLMTSSNPVVPGWDFKILIMTGDEKFHIAINDQPYCTYNYRLSLEAVHVLAIGGDVQKIYQVDHRKIFPSPYPMLHTEGARSTELSFDVPRQMFPGHVFVISAIPSGSQNGGFYIQINHGASKRQMMHISARFKQRIVVMNCHTDTMEWRKDEEQSGVFPFQLEQLFKLAVAITDTSFIIAVDGEIIMNYAFRYTNSFLNNLGGIKITSEKGMQLEVQGVDHLNMGVSDCEGFEQYSHPDVQIQ